MIPCPSPYKLVRTMASLSLRSTDPHLLRLEILASPSVEGLCELTVGRRDISSQGQNGVLKAHGRLHVRREIQGSYVT